MKLLDNIASKNSRVVVGLMTGTSADGIDAVIVNLSSAGMETEFEILGHSVSEMSSDLRERLFELFQPGALVDDLCVLNFELGTALADAALQVMEDVGITSDDVDLIGSHGQTVRHFPTSAPSSTLQIGEPAVISQRTGVTTIADFRPADVALGGEGAPLVPLVDRLLFGHTERGRLMLNIGGIANVTVLPANAGIDDIIGFDLGPGNMLVDAVVSFLTGGSERFDRDGNRAAAGAVDKEWLQRLMQHDFLKRSPPKSTGREEFGGEYLYEMMANTDLSGDDLVSTLTAFTSRSIIQGISQFALSCGKMDELWVSGGGVHNKHLVEQIRQALPDLEIGSVDELGVPADAKEALAFAVLANETLVGNSGNLPGVTGAQHGAVLGKICLGREQGIDF